MWRPDSLRDVRLLLFAKLLEAEVQPGVEALDMVDHQPEAEEVVSAAFTRLLLKLPNWEVDGVMIDHEERHLLDSDGLELSVWLLLNQGSYDGAYVYWALFAPDEAMYADVNELCNITSSGFLRRFYGLERLPRSGEQGQAKAIAKNIRTLVRNKGRALEMFYNPQPHVDLENTEHVKLIEAEIEYEKAHG